VKDKEIKREEMESSVMSKQQFLLQWIKLSGVVWVFFFFWDKVKGKENTYI
jgi:hypothetical protein